MLRRALISSSVAMAMCPSLTRGGELTPPAGPVAPTPGPEPRIAINATNTPGNANSIFRITQSGSYYLTGNVNGAVGFHGIEIAASNVTLDLMGYTVLGVPGSLDGIRTASSVFTRVTVRNGMVSGWGEDGIDLTANTAGGDASRVENVNVSNIAVFGILTNTASKIEGCIVLACSTGIWVGQGSAVRDCVVKDCTANGITTSPNCLVSACVAFSNDGIGISLFFGSRVIDCVSNANNADGIRTSGESLVRGNVCRSNGSGANDGAGIHAGGNGDTIDSNTVTGNDRGIDVDFSGNLIIRNTARGNTIE